MHMHRGKEGSNKRTRKLVTVNLGDINLGGISFSSSFYKVHEAIAVSSTSGFNSTCLMELG